MKTLGNVKGHIITCISLILNSKKVILRHFFCPFNALETGKLPGSLVKKNVKLNIVTNHLFNPNKNTSDT